MKFDYILSIGHRCTSQIAINNLKSFYGETTPFSWVNNFNSKNIVDIIKNNFEDYLEKECKSPNYFLLENLSIKNNEYGFGHYNLKDVKIVESFNRKIKRFKYYLNNTKNNILFVYINEDYIYNEDYRRDYKLNYKNLQELDNHLRLKYPNLKYNLLNISFEEIENYGNIINYYYKPSKLINRSDWINNNKIRSKIENNFRNDCKKILLNFIKN